MKRCSVLITFLILQGCVTKSEWADPIQGQVYQQTANEPLYSNAPKLLNVDQVLALDPAVESDFYDFFNQPQFEYYPAVERVGIYLGLLVDQFTYSEKTYTAQQTVEHKGGNCLSLTLLTTAIANLAGVEISYDLLGEDPTYSMDSNILISADHMRAVLKSNLQSQSDVGHKAVTERITIDYFDTQGMTYVENVSPEYQMSLYYSNKAAEYLIDGNPAYAYFYAKKSVETHSLNPSALNTLVILHRQKGDLEGAENILKAAISENVGQAPLFYRSYIALLESQNRVKELATIKKQYELLNDKHPVEWIKAGMRAHEEKKYVLAVNHYGRALDIAPNMHRVHLLVALSKLAEGNHDGAQKQLLTAMNNAPDTDIAAAYKGKFAKLKHFNLNAQ